MKLCHRTKRHLGSVFSLIAILLGTSGCTAFLAPRDPFPATPPEPPLESSVPRELDKVTLPRYVIEPPDILLIEGVKLVPKSPHRIETFDVLLIRVSGALPEYPIDDAFPIDADGSVNLGPRYGRIKLVGLTIEEAEDEVRSQLSQLLTEVDVSISLVQAAGAQAVTGQHLVGLDGRVNLATYGPVYVAGMTLEEARGAIEKQLALKLEDPEVFVDVLAYNSKVYYIVTPRRRLWRQRGALAYHGQRNSARRGGDDRRHFANFVDEPLDRPTGS